MCFAINNQIFDRQSLPLSGWKDVPANCTKIITDKRNNKLSEPIVFSLRHSQKLPYPGGIDGIKTPLNRAKTEIPSSKSIIHLFNSDLWSMNHAQKMTF